MNLKLRRQFEETQRELEKSKNLAELQNKELAQIRQEQQLSKQELQSSADDEVKIKALEDELGQSEIELQRSKGEMGSLKNKVQQLEIAAKSDRDQLAMIAKTEGGDLGSGPIIELIDPKLDITRGIKQVVKTRSGSERTIVGKVIALNGLHTFTVNGVEERVDQGGLFRFSKRVQDKEYPIRLVAVDKRGGSTSLEFLLAPEVDKSIEDKQDMDFGKFYALIIGNYQYSDTNWQDLQTPKSDAIMVAKILKERYGFKTEILLNATRLDFFQALEKYIVMLTKNDNFLIYFAGHGQLDEELNRGYWIPVDGVYDNPAGWISTLAIADLLSVIKANHILIVADSCYSGSLTRSSIPRIDANISPEAFRQLLSKKSRMALTSGDLQPVLDAGGEGNSIFAKAFIEVLKNNDKVLAGQNLHNQVYNNVVSKVEQVPQYAPIQFAGHQAGDYFFVPLN